MDPTTLRPVGRSGLSVTQFGYGSAPLSGFRDQLPEFDAIDTVVAAYDSGIRLFDTSPYYGYGVPSCVSARRCVIGHAATSCCRPRLAAG
jgi:D-threo-aldose 1-dehydrogenase